MIEDRKQQDMIKQCPRCGHRMTLGAPHADGPVLQWECGDCGNIVIEPVEPRQ